MSRQLFCIRAMWARLDKYLALGLPQDRSLVGHSVFLPVFCQAKSDLAASGQFDIKLGQQFRVQQGAMLHPVAAIDAIARAQRIQ